jgi:hypothetical protein
MSLVTLRLLVALNRQPRRDNHQPRRDNHQPRRDNPSALQRHMTPL